MEGKDPESRNHRPATFKYFLAVSYRFPRLKGVEEEPDPTTAKGFEDPALLPRGTDDLADEDPIEQIGDPKGEAEVESREDYEDSLYQPSGCEEEDEHEHGHGVRAAKVEEEPFVVTTKLGLTLRISCFAYPCPIATTEAQRYWMRCSRCASSCVR